MNIRSGVRSVSGIPVIWTHGEVNSDAVPAIQKQVDELLASGQKKIIIDVSKVIYVDTDGLGLMIDIHEKCVGADGNMTVVCTNNPKVYRNFKLLRLVERFGVHESIESALVVLKTER